MHTDGTEDEEIHCLKEGGVAADARKTIERDTASLPLQQIRSRNQTPSPMLKRTKKSWRRTNLF